MYFLGSVISFILMLVLTPVVIKVSGHYTSPIKEELCLNQQKKAGIGHFGGIVILVCFLIGSNFVVLDEKSRIVIISLLLFGSIGMVDDLIKIRAHSSDGLSSLNKLFFQVLSATIIIFLLAKNEMIEPSFLNICFGIVYIVFFVNAINITDGLDGLAGLVAIPIIVLLYFLFNLGINIVFLFTLLGFLYFNAGKAKIFMGDTGSHVIGALIGVEALIVNKPFLILFVSIIPVIELFSSLIQIIAIRGFEKKVFIIAPYHHHLEYKGINENLIVARFTIISVIFCILGFTLLK